MESIINKSKLRFFEDFGFLRFNGLLKDSIECITQAFEEVWAAHGDGHHGDVHDGSKRSCIVPFIDRHEQLCKLLDDSRILEIAKRILGDDFNYCTSDGNLYSGVTPYHSHRFFGNVQAMKIAFYLDPVDASSGCLRVIPGSHKFGDEFSDNIHKLIGKSEEHWGITQDKIPHVALESNPGDIIIFNHALKHGSFGGGKRRRLFVINVSQRFPKERISSLREMVSGIARFWVDQYYLPLMIETADSERMKHLEQVIENQDHLPVLAEQARSKMSEPSRG
jgi:hypothetical protein